MTVKIKTNYLDVRHRLKRREKVAKKDIQSLIATATMDVRKTVVEGIQGPPKTGRTYTRRTVTHKASAAGEYPATDTGFLASNISSKVSLVELEGVVTSSAPYSKHLEYGTTNMQARPFMFPSLEKTKPKIRRMFKEAGIMKKVRN